MSILSAKVRKEAFFTYKMNAGEGLCWVKGCRKKSRHNASLCSMHTMQKWRANNKQCASYNALRDHAKERGIAFTINHDYWKGLTDGYNFFAQTDEVLTIDRIKAHLGYEPGNLRVVSHSENVAKGNRERYLPEHVQDMLRREREAAQEDVEEYLEDEDPF